MTRPVPPAWATEINAFIDYLAAKGQPKTTRDQRRAQLEHLARRAPCGPWEMTYEQLEAFCSAQAWARETRRGRYTAFSLFWRWGRKQGRCARNIAKRLPAVRASAPRPLPAPVAIYEAAMRRADDRTRLILRMAKEAGMRRAEIAVAGSWDLLPDLIGWSIVVHGKGGKTRVVPLTPRLALELRALGEGHFFPGAIDGHLSPRRVGELAAEVLPEPWTLHKLRARFGTDTLESSGGDYGLVQELMGHASPATTKHYVPVNPRRARAAVELAAAPTNVTSMLSA